MPLAAQLTSSSSIPPESTRERASIQFERLTDFAQAVRAIAPVDVVRAGR